MQRVGSTGRGRAPARAGLVGAAAAVIALLVLSACTSGNGHAGRSPVAHDNTPAATSRITSASPTTPAAQITTTPSSHAISPIQPVRVAIAHGKLTSVTMRNPAGKQVTGQLAGDGLSWRTTEDLGYAKTYTIVARGVSEDGTPVTRISRVTTLTPNNLTMPYIDDIYGSSIQDGGSYGIGMVVRVHFDESVNRKLAERTLHVTTSPAVTGGWFWDDNQNVYWRPQQYYTPGSKVTVTAKVYGVEVGDGLYGQADQSVSFTIGPKHYSVADAKTHQVKVYWNDKLVRTMPTSMGRGGIVQGKNGPIYLWTMPGTYTVLGFENPAIMSSDSYGLPSTSEFGYPPEKVYWSTKISTDGIYLHELDNTVPEQGHQNVSHGCLNLNHDNAKWFYQNSQVGDIVKVINSGGPHIQFWQGGEWDVPWSQWVAGSALH